MLLVKKFGGSSVANKERTIVAVLPFNNSLFIYVSAPIPF